MIRRAGPGRARQAISGGVGRLLVEFGQSVAAMVWRTLLFRTTFIVITGNFGKTAAKDCLGAILSLEGPTVMAHGGMSGRRAVCATILRARPHHRFVIIEVALAARGGILAHAYLIRPKIAVILSLDPACSGGEQAKLPRLFGPSGILVLNGDDPAGARIVTCPRLRVVRFGFGSGCEVHASQPSSIWPRRLQVRVSTPDESCVIYTRLVGTHWAPSVLGAIAAAYACRVSLNRAWKALQEVHPHLAALQPAPLPSGAVMLRDEGNGAIQSFEAALAVVRNASATRKVLVISDCSDFAKSDQERQAYYAKCAASIFDSVVFVGEWSHYGLKHALVAGMDPDNVHGFVSLGAVSEFLRRDLREGDLVLLRGRATDHLSRIYHAQLGPVACSKARCERLELCDHCSELGAIVTSEPNVQDVELLHLPSWGKTEEKEASTVQRWTTHIRR